ncbi:heavy metal translocating P-type ATPase [Fusibacter ferrireducens]|uniref:Cd(2+)-exporting ATPase n=1 Tax=Fusibacter ferrireducens TaxID=2785058 RepID=A0ABR9ZRK0_9FIRM|nr:heavy metal translocating P-type ATPase [Fusibacter ferrireducens]MBF4693077.1 heavy metal translocating P-type ATPase [Fusibacter ferrireducens]
MTRVDLYLDGLGCANCAAKIETKTKGIHGLSKVNLDFSQSKLTFEYDEKHISKQDSSLKIKEIEKIVTDLEPDVKVVLKSDLDSKVTADAHKSHTIKELIRLGISLALFFSSFAAPEFELKLGLLGVAYIISGHRVLFKSFKNILKGRVFDENFLMSIATFGAIGIGEYPEAVAVMIFYEIGEFFEDLAVNHSRDAIKSLINIRPDKAILVGEHSQREVSPEEVKINDVILVKPGMRIPLDGTIIEGRTMIDTSALTGESLPMSYGINDSVLSGTVVINAVIKIKVTKVYKDSTVARILDLVENASGQKAKTEHFITKFARVYTPIVVGIAAFIAIVPPLVISGAHFHEWLYKSLIFLVISCPCALVLSVPLGFFSGIGTASKNGILVKGSNYLEALSQIDTVVFDKTGTLTKGRFEVSNIVLAKDASNKDLIESAYLCERNSTHPIAKSIIEYISKLENVSEFETITGDAVEEISGKGVKVEYADNVYLAGNASIAKLYDLSVPELEMSGTIVYIFKNKQYLGAIVLGDMLKPDSQKTIDALNKMNHEVWMLTGDRELQANEIAKTLSIKNYRSALLPEDKFKQVQDLKDKGKKIAFLGDGINDAPVLTLADVGISMGSIGSDAAIEASDIVFMTDEPSKLVTAISISKFTKRIVSQNIIFALGIKILIMILGVIGFGTMWLAIFGDVGVALLAVLNSSRVLRFKHQ